MRLQGKVFGLGALATAAACASMAGRAGGAVIDFEGRKRGEIVDNQYAGFAGGVIISADNADSDGPDVAAIFVADPNFTRPDPDLRPPYRRGNMAGGPLPNKVLIIPENTTDIGTRPPGRGPNGLIDFPKGEAEGGKLEFLFSEQQASIGFDVLGARGITRNRANGFSLKFFQDEAFLGQVTFRRFINKNSQFYDPTVKFGEHSINEIKPIRAEQLGSGVTSFNRVEFNLGGSGALDRINFEPGVVPEPGTAAIALIGLVGVHTVTGRSRRRR